MLLKWLLIPQIQMQTLNTILTYLFKILFFIGESDRERKWWGQEERENLAQSHMWGSISWP